MAVVNVTGAQSGVQAWNWDTDEYHATGNVTLDGTCVLTITGNANPFRFDGAFYVNCAAGSIIVSNGSVSAKKTWKANANPRAGACDGPYLPLAAGAPGVGCSITFNIFRDSNFCCYFQNSTRAITFSDNEMVDCVTPITNLATILQPITRCRWSRCTNAASVNTGTAQTFTDCDGSVSLAGAGNHTLTRHRCVNGEASNEIAVSATGTVLIDEPYVAGTNTNGIVQSGAATGTIQNGVVAGGAQKRGINYGVYRTAGTLAVSGMDVTDMILQGIFGATTVDDCYLAGNNRAAQSNIDTDSGNTTSTSTPGQYSTLTNNLTNPRATPKKPLTTSALGSSGLGANGITITWTSGIRSSSIVRYGTASGVYTMQNAPQDDDWTGLEYGRAQHTTSHSVALVNLKPGTTYYYQVGGVDPLGREMTWSAEQSFATTAAGGGNLINNRSLVGAT